MSQWARISGGLRREVAAAGIDPARLVMAPRLPLTEHLARYRMADLFLDTLPCNGHTTTSDALWAGCPVLTRPGAAFAERVAASLLTAAGLPELIAPDDGAYLAEPGRLPHFDTARFARNLEAAYAGMWRRGARPSSSDILPDGAIIVAPAGA